MKPYIIFAVIGVLVVIGAYKYEGVILDKLTLSDNTEKGTEIVIPVTMPVITEQEKPVVVVKDKFKMETIAEGTGEPIKVGDLATVHYTGTLKDGTKFDSSVDKGQPFQFTLGSGEVIQGWEQGILGMKVGEKRKLIIPADMGYGDRAVGPIPANSTLYFDVELMKIN